MGNSLKIYYFTGTGNALAAAKWISQIASEKDFSVEIIKITPTIAVSKNQILDNDLIVFCYPTHGFNAPPVVIDFVFRFPKSKNKVYLLNTRAGMKISKLFLPGLSGLAQLLPALILFCKGFQLKGFQPMDLPSNWISIHPGLRKTVIESIFKRCKQKTMEFANKILTERSVCQGLISLPFDLLISPISLAYYFYGRFALAKTFVADIECNACGICEKECPVNAILMIKQRPFWTRKCESCMHCMNNCPQRAIQTPHVFIVFIWWLVFSIFPNYLAKILVSSESFIARHFELLVWIFILITGLPIIFFSYRIMHYLMRFRLFNWLISNTSLTKLKFWRRYTPPKIDGLRE